MFTGIVEIMGTVDAIEKDSTGGLSLTIGNAREILGDCNLGDSISTNGVCLTVTDFDVAKGQFKVGVSPETIRKTNLAELQVGMAVDLERAMSANSRFGGHQVQGHIDCTVTITSIVDDPPNSKIFNFVAPAEFLTYIVPKGYVALDGASLTVIDVDWETKQFSVMLIAYTQTKIVLAAKQVGDKVNLEVDGVGKLLESMIKGMLESKNGPLMKLLEQAVSNILNK